MDLVEINKSNIMDKGLKEFKVAIDDLGEFAAIVDLFNEDHRTDFNIDSSDFWDGVEFAFVSCRKATLDDIFLLGSRYEGSPLRTIGRYYPPPKK